MINEIDYGSTKVPGYSAEGDVSDQVNSFIDRVTSVPPKETEGFSASAYLNGLRTHTGNDLRGEKKWFGRNTDNVDVVKESVVNLSNYAAEYIENDYYEGAVDYFKKARTEIENFLIGAHEAGITGKDLADSMVVLAGQAGLEIDSSNLTPNNFASTKDMTNDAHDIVKKSISMNYPDDEGLEKSFERATDSLEGKGVALNVKTIRQDGMNDPEKMKEKAGQCSNILSPKEDSPTNERSKRNKLTN